MTTVNTGDTPSGEELTAAYARFVRKLADEANATTTIGDDDELLIDLDANKAYEVEHWLLINSPAATDYKIQHSVPSGVTGWWNARVRNLAAAADTVWQGTLGWGSQGQFEGSAADLMFQLKGILITSGTAGQMKLQWASNAAGTTTVKATSFIKLTEMT